MKLKRFSNMPGWTGWPIIGAIPYLAKFSEAKYMEWANLYGPIYRLKIGSWDCVILNGFSAINEALIIRGSDFCNRPNTAAISLLQNSNEGVFFSQYSKNRTRLHLYFAAKLKQFPSEIKRITAHSANTLCKNLETIGCSNDLQANLDNACAEIITKIFLKDKTFDDTELSELIKEVYEPFLSYKFSAVLMMPWLQHLPFIGSYLKENSLKRNELVEKVLSWFIESANNNTAVANTFKDAQVKDMKNIAAGFIDMIFTGTRTISCQIVWVLYFLLRNPECMKITKEEVHKDDDLGLKNFYENTSKLSYVRACIYETFRLRSISPVGFVRTSLRESSVGGYHIPEGVMVIANLWSVHHDQEYWGDDVDDFKPERHLDKKGNFIKSDHVIPFSIGERRCMAAEIAEIEILIFIHTIIKRFEISVEGNFENCDPRGISGSILKPPPLNLKFTPSNNIRSDYASTSRKIK